MLQVEHQPLSKPQDDAMRGMFASQPWIDLIHHVAALRDEAIAKGGNATVLKGDFPAMANEAQEEFRKAEAYQTFLKIAEQCASRREGFLKVTIKSTLPLA